MPIVLKLDMADSEAIEQHTVEMIVLGGRFQLGGLYDYRNDQTLPGNNKNFQSVNYIKYCTYFKNQIMLTE